MSAQANKERKKKKRTLSGIRTQVVCLTDNIAVFFCRTLRAQVYNVYTSINLYMYINTCICVACALRILTCVVRKELLSPLGLRLYDSFTGEFVWECDEHEAPGTRLWTTPTFSHHHGDGGSCGVFSSSGVWVLRSKKVTEHALLIAHSLLPMAPSDEVSTSLIMHAKKLFLVWVFGSACTCPV